MGKGGETAPDADASDGLLVLALAYEKALNPPGLVPGVDADAADTDAADGESAAYGSVAVRACDVLLAVCAAMLGSECTSRSAPDPLLLLAPRLLPPLRTVS